MEEHLNTDELIARMMLDETEDAPKITPVNYGKLRGIKPQLVYYHIRARHIPVMTCDCGRKVIDKEEADAYFRSIGKLAPLREGPSEPTPRDGAGGPEPA
jgi:hypothetical protein